MPTPSSSERALERGLHQAGSLGSGNHFLEVQAVDLVADEAAVAALGLHEGQVCVMIHSGSRGLGHQVCSDHVLRVEAAMARHGIHVADRQLACVPVRSPEGEAYLAAMAAAANYGRANRHLLAVAPRRAFAAAVGTDRLATTSPDRRSRSQCGPRRRWRGPRPRHRSGGDRSTAV